MNIPRMIKMYFMREDDTEECYKKEAHIEEPVVIEYELGSLLSEMEERFCLEDKGYAEVVEGHKFLDRISNTGQCLVPTREITLNLWRNFKKILSQEWNFPTDGNLIIDFSFLRFNIKIGEGLIPDQIYLRLRGSDEPITRGYLSYIAQLLIFLEDERKRLERNHEDIEEAIARDKVAKWMCKPDFVVFKG